MSAAQDKPDFLKVLDGLKDFQRRTVEYVFRRLYLDGDSEQVNRFLIADEVGLGKTLVARGLIAKTMDYLWDKRHRLDVVYICANSDIARQNINKLNVTRQKKMTFASRMTLLPLHTHDLDGQKLNFVSFTPSTSFDLRSAGGRWDERVLIYEMLRQAWDLTGDKGVNNLMRLGVRWKNWKSLVKDFQCSLESADPDRKRIDPSLQASFVQALNKEGVIRRRFEELAERFVGYTKSVPDEDRAEQVKLIGDLRRILAKMCVKALEPDVVILDEFQRFKTILDGQDEIAELAHDVFNYPDAKVLLLSATPYKMYTMYYEQETDNHYEDFIRTVEFLFHDEARTKSFEEDLVRYRRELLKARDGNAAELVATKNVIEQKLRQVMVRTERVSSTIGQDSMIQAATESVSGLTTCDLGAFRTLDRVAHHLDVGDSLEYWKSAPYLLNMMDRGGYKLKEEFVDQVEGGEHPELASILANSMDSMIRWDAIRSYQKLDPANAKLRQFMSRGLEQGAWQLLWVPPSLPYYQASRGPYADAQLKSFTKSLIFSSWKVVPKVVAMLASYEAERRMTTGLDKNADYAEERRKRRPLLTFAKSKGRLTGMPVLCLAYPCRKLATIVDPLAVSGGMANDSMPSDSQVRQAVRAQIEPMVQALVKKHSDPTAQVDERWYWVAMALLDAEDGIAEQWLAMENEEYDWHLMVTARDDAEEQDGQEEDEGEKEEMSDSRFAEHVDEFVKALSGELDLGKVPPDLVDVLTSVAVASPAVVTLRALMRVCRHPELIPSANALLAGAARVAMAFRGMFNLPESIALIRSIFEKDDGGYWQSVLDYCQQGNLQSVMDEYLHVLYESTGANHLPPDEATATIVKEVVAALSLRTVSLGFDEIKVQTDRLVLRDRSMRCRYALRFGDDRAETEQTGNRREQVRQAFNSPFRPFVLATTSVGQEGLDFHQYCHEIYHWNLPANPVDLEQREGRIHRYKGHVIRRNVAATFPLSAAAALVEEFKDPWSILFDLAKARYRDRSDLIPYWIFEDGGHRVLRHVPALPMSLESERLDYLRRTVVAYRMVLGQPRQEDLVNYLKTSLGSSMEEFLSSCKIDLAPPASA